jgi:hypothetical protein
MDALKAVSLAADGWAAGLAASRVLGALVEGRAIACEPRGRGLLRRHFLSYAAPVAVIWARTWCVPAWRWRS